MCCNQEEPFTKGHCVCVCVPHLLCVCGGGDGGGAGAGGHPVVLPFAI